MTWLGRRSYALYLIHEPIRVAAEESRLHGELAHLPNGVAVNVALVAAFITVSLILTEISWRVVEAPAQRMRRALQKKHVVSALG